MGTSCFFGRIPVNQRLSGNKTELYQLLREEGFAIAQDKDTWAFPPVETLFVQRKVSGTALLGTRLKAKVNIRRITEEVLANTERFEVPAA